MMNSGLVLGDILKSAGWSNASTFYKFYHRSVELEAMLNSGLILDDILNCRMVQRFNILQVP